MESTKKWWQSKGVIGSIVAVLALGGQMIGYEINPELQETAVNLFADGVAFVGVVLAFVGRLVASKKVVA